MGAQSSLSTVLDYINVVSLFVVMVLTGEIAEVVGKQADSSTYITSQLALLY